MFHFRCKILLEVHIMDGQVRKLQVKQHVFHWSCKEIDLTQWIYKQT